MNLNEGVIKQRYLGLGRTPFFPSIKNGNCNTSRLQTCYAVLLIAIDLWESVLLEAVIKHEEATI